MTKDPIKVTKNDFAEIERYAPEKEGEEEVWSFEIFEDPELDPYERFNPMFELTRSQVEALIMLIFDAKVDEKPKEKVCTSLEEMFRHGGKANCGVRNCPAKRDEGEE